MQKSRERVRENFRKTFQLPSTNHGHYGNRREPTLPWRDGLRESSFMVSSSSKFHTLFIDNLPSNMSNLWLYQIFKNEGSVVDAFVSKKKRKNNNQSFGFVRFRYASDAENAIKHNNFLEINNIQVTWSKYKHPKAIADKPKNMKRQTAPQQNQRIWKPALRDVRSYREVV